MNKERLSNNVEGWLILSYLILSYLILYYLILYINNIMFCTDSDNKYLDCRIKGYKVKIDYTIKDGE